MGVGNAPRSPTPSPASSRPKKEALRRSDRLSAPICRHHGASTRRSTPAPDAPSRATAGSSRGLRVSRPERPADVSTVAAYGAAQHVPAQDWAGWRSQNAVEALCGGKRAGDSPRHPRARRRGSGRYRAASAVRFLVIRRLPRALVSQREPGRRGGELERPGTSLVRCSTLRVDEAGMREPEGDRWQLFRLATW